MNYANLVDWIILLSLAVTMFYLIRVSKGLKATRKIYKSLKADLQLFTKSSEKTQDALNNLERARSEMTRSIGKDKRELQHLKDDMLYLTEQGKTVADRLEGSLHSLRPLQKVAKDSPKAKSYSKAEREALMKSIENLR